MFCCIVQGADAQPSRGSISGGYGIHKVCVRGDFKLTEKMIKVPNSSTRMYLELGVDWQSFDNPTFYFNSTPYRSDTWMLAAGIGLGQEFIIKKWFVVYPYIGLFYKYARFTDGALVDAIGTYNMQRYWNGQPVGQVVENGYGNLVTVDIGTRIGFRIGKVFEIGGTIAFAPAAYSSQKTLFGEYWGVAPYHNDYYINRLFLKAEGCLRFNIPAKIKTTDTSTKPKPQAQ